MQQVIVFSYLQRHLKKLLPLICRLRGDARIELTVILMTQEEQVFARQQGLEFEMLDAFCEKKRTCDFDLGWGLEPLINAIDSIKPALFIASEVNYILRNTIRYCKQQQVASLIVQHGTPNKYSLHAFAPFEGDCFAAWSEFTRDFLVSNHVADDKIVVTGGIPFDDTLSIMPDKIKIASEIGGVDPALKWILFTTQGVGAGGRPSEAEIFASVTEVALQAKRHADHQLIYQVHPGQTISYIKEMVDTVENHGAVVARYRNTEELISACDCMITFFSTTAIDAIILKKPLLLINLTDTDDFFPFVKMGAAFGVHEKEKISIALTNLLHNSAELSPHIAKAAEYVNYKNDQGALDRVVQLCYDKLFYAKEIR